MTVHDQLIRVGILGLGGIGATHARALASLSRSGSAIQLAAFSGGTPELAAECGWPDARRLAPDDLIADDDLDVLAVCTPSALHHGHTMAALRNGRHVVVEKPMALTVEEAVEIRDFADAQGLVVSPMAQRRFEPLNVALKAALSSGNLGRVVLGETFVHWHRSDAYYQEAPWRSAPDGGGGSLMNQGLHNVDLLCWLLGGVAKVVGLTATLGHQIMVEDTTVASLQFSSGALGVIATTTATPPGAPAELAIWTTAGSVRVDQDGIREWNFPGIERPADPEVAVTGASDPSAIGISGHVAQWADIVHALQSGGRPAITADDGLDTVAVLDGIYRAARQGARLDTDTVASNTGLREVTR
jgi:UDP-N-acetyl-2-amino-2-deoxyglucuronate dehydrogenase